MIWLRKHLYAILATAKAVLLALAYAKGRKDANDRRDAKDERAAHDTRKRIDQVTRGSSPDSDRDWLRKRGKR
jgi:hypothetical protein